MIPLSSYPNSVGLCEKASASALHCVTVLPFSIHQILHLNHGIILHWVLFLTSCWIPTKSDLLYETNVSRHSPKNKFALTFHKGRCLTCPYEPFYEHLPSKVRAFVSIIYPAIFTGARRMSSQEKIPKKTVPPSHNRAKL